MHHKAVGLDVLSAQVLGAPVPDGGEDGHEAAAQVGHGVLHPGRDLGVDGAGDKAVGFQLPQLEGQHPGGGGNVLLELGEAQGSAAETPEDQGFVLAADQLQGGFHRAMVVLFHRKLLAVRGDGIQKDSMAQKGAYLQFLNRMIK